MIAFLSRDQGHQKIGQVLSAGMDRIGAAEFLFRPVEGVVMQHAAGHIVLKIAPLKRQDQPVARRTDDASGPDFHIERDHLAGLDFLNFVMAVIGAVGQRTFRIGLALRGAQPAARDRRWFVRTDKHHLFVVRVKQAQGGEEIQITAP